MSLRGVGVVRQPGPGVNQRGRLGTTREYKIKYTKHKSPHSSAVFLYGQGERRRMTWEGWDVPCGSPSPAPRKPGNTSMFWEVGQLRYNRGCSHLPSAATLATFDKWWFMSTRCSVSEGPPLKLTENVGIVCKRTFRTYFKLLFRTTSGEPNPNPSEGRALGGRQLARAGSGSHGSWSYLETSYEVFGNF